MIIAIVTAAGLGKRANLGKPKQLYYMPDGKTIVQHTADIFAAIPEISHVIITYHPEYKKYYPNETEYIHLVEGGKTRQQSVHQALLYAQTLCPDRVLIHDAARPYVSQKLIKNVLQQLQNHKAVDVALPIYDTVKSHVNYAVLDRENLYMTQTPQGFDFKTILHLHNKYCDLDVTDDISLYIKDYNDVGFVEGERHNIKITTAIDFNNIMENKSNYCFTIGNGFDVHKIYERLGSFIHICGVKIECNIAIEAHSDGDVGLHAAVDAILGALGEGDIGEHFPPHDNKWKDCDSLVFLRHAKKLCEQHNATIENIDLTIICEHPKIAVYKMQMRQVIASALNIATKCVNIKATTTEKLGFIGRKEGIAAQASCMLRIRK